MFIRPSQSLQPLTTAHLAQTMTLLGLTSTELLEKIEEELSQNPALEMSDESNCPICKRTLRNKRRCEHCSQPPLTDSDEPIVYFSSREDVPYRPRQNNAEYDSLDDFSAPSRDTLATHVLRQISPDLEGKDREIAAHILTSLNEDGILEEPIMHISRYHHVPTLQVEQVIDLIKRADPIGVGASSPQDALLTQIDILESRSEEGGTKYQHLLPLAKVAIEDGMNFLSRHQYDNLAKLLGTNTPTAQMVFKFISENLNPYPGRAAWGKNQPMDEYISKDLYHSPDVIIHKDKEEDDLLSIEIITPYSGSLRINPLFRMALQSAPDDKKDDWKKHIENASLLIKCIQQRNNTMRRMLVELVALQKEFIIKGDRHLKPTTRAKLADILEVHESTISRAVSDKSAQLPSGKIIPLSKFFDPSLHIRSVVRDIIDDEVKPLTDSQIATILESQGIKVARRTVAKYRNMEGILPAYLRKNKIPTH